jgi:hypothetical protein
MRSYIGVISHHNVMITEDIFKQLNDFISFVNWNEDIDNSESNKYSIYYSIDNMVWDSTGGNDMYLKFKEAFPNFLQEIKDNQIFSIFEYEENGGEDDEDIFREINFSR